MIHLNRIYTRTGDDGSTMLGDGSRVAKNSARVEAYGDLDELNSFLGVAIVLAKKGGLKSQLQAIQNTLFDVSSDLCVPMPPKGDGGKQAGGGRLARQKNHPRLPASRATELELWIDGYNEHLKPLDSFILPGGSDLAAALHVARCVCRRAERRVLTLAQKETINPEVLKYVNRLSDYLFVVARVANRNGKTDVKWRPGK